MTKRQIKLGVTENDIKNLKEKGELNSFGTFKAWMANLKKGQYNSEQITKMIYGNNEEYLLKFRKEEIKQFLLGISINNRDNFNYSDTLGLDILTVR
jgi:hypothetical protein